MEEKVKTAEWLHLCSYDTKNHMPQCYCSRCGHVISAYYPPDTCEHCGAKMGVEDLWKKK